MRAAVLAEIGLSADATYQRQGERLLVPAPRHPEGERRGAS